jgi:hypothetical protein
VKLFFCLLAAALLLPEGLFAAGMNFYVSLLGNDVNDGARGRVVRSLERARDLARTVNQKTAMDIVVYNIATEFHGGIGICVGYAQRTVVAHNQIDHLSYTGISMGWGGWPDKIEMAGQANNSENNVVADNLIFDHMLLLADGAAI